MIKSSRNLEKNLDAILKEKNLNLNLLIGLDENSSI